MAISKTSILVLCVLCPMAALAHDLVQPEWRGQDGTTFQHWRFDNDDNPAEPDVIDNPFGGATATITVGEFGGHWLDDPGLGQTGIWDIGGQGGQIALHIDNQSSELEYADVWVQVTFYAGITEAPTVNVPGAVLLSEEVVLVSDDPPGRWDMHQSRWVIYPAQEYEQVILTSNPVWGSMIDQVVVDTRLAPANCIVDLNQLVKFCEQWPLTGPDMDFDLDNSGGVDFEDFSMFANSWLHICPW